MQRADTGISRPTEYQFARHSGGDHLVVNEIGCEAAKGEVLFSLANDLVAGGERDEMGEPFRHDHITVGNKSFDRFRHGEKLPLFKAVSP